MDPLLAGLGAPTVVSAAQSVVRTVSTAVKPFLSALRSAGEKLDAAEEGVVENLQTRATALRGKLAQRAKEIATAAGVQIAPPLRVRISETDGRLELVDPHPQRAILEAALNEDDAFAGKLNELLAMNQLLAASGESSVDGGRWLELDWRPQETLTQETLRELF